MKLLNGKELAQYIKVRQAKDVRTLKQADRIFPKLAIVRMNPDPVVDSYMRLKLHYGEDIGVEVGVHSIPQSQALSEIEKLNADQSVHGIIVQIPLPDKRQTDAVLAAVSPHKDVDGLAPQTKFDPATPMAIAWLLAGYNVELNGKQIVVLGQGRLVGRPLTAMWRASGLNVLTADRNTPNISEITLQADVLVCATGTPGVIKKDMVKPNAIIVDAGVATDKNGLIGDVSPDVRELESITITPEKGGVGPLTVCALFENVIRSARRAIDIQP